MAIEPPDNGSSSCWVRLLGVLALTALWAAACGGVSDDTAADEGVATLESVEGSDEEALGTGPDSAENSEEGAPASAEQAALDFAACMRDAGIDFPDPTVDADGNPVFDRALRAGAEGGIDPRSGEFRSAIETCQELTEGFTFGRGPGGVDQTALQDAMLPYTECLRDEGLDVGDFTFGGGPAAGGDGDSGGDGAGQGQRGDRGGDPADRIASVLGIDADDPAAAAALETCQPLLEEAFSAFGPGAEAEG